MNATRAWIALAIGVIIYELFADHGELLSEGVDRALETHPWITRAAVLYLAGHLVNAIPARIDPLNRFTIVCVRVAPMRFERRYVLVSAPAKAVR